MIALFQDLAVGDSGVLGQDPQREFFVPRQDLRSFDHRHDELLYFSAVGRDGGFFYS
jgi:hypothetical protein